MRSQSITIVSHCYSPPGCDMYVQHLKWQLSSLIHHPSQATVKYVVFHDASANEILKAVPASIDGLSVMPIQLSLDRLLRRAIGRHIAAQEVTTDVIWFADADYYFGPGCLDCVTDQMSPDNGLRFPRKVMENIDHESGDAMVESNRNIQWPMIDPLLFKQRRRQFAIGGLQIVGGRRARKVGYLGGTRWTEPVDPKRGWHQTSEDMAFRREFASSKAIDIDNLYWIRHAVKGANMDGGGVTVGKEMR